MREIMVQHKSAVSVDQLGTAELFCLASLRLWVFEQVHLKGTESSWGKTMAKSGLCPQGITALDAFLKYLSRFALGPIDVRPPSCTRISDDEQLYLQAVAHGQWTQRSQLALVLQAWLPPTALRFAIPALNSFCESLSRKRLCLPVVPLTEEMRPTPKRHFVIASVPTTIN